MSEYIPWIEKYRPKNFNDIVLDSTNRQLFEGILKINKFPNILLYGPPGTGKTTTIINIINKYQENNNQLNKQLRIHLNASDERGIDIIRVQISQFVQSKSLFVKGTKFVVLDEVDYMTKNAQIALKQLLHMYSDKVTFCLICNYISKIDLSLQNEFLRIRFNQLPNKLVFNYLKNIIIKENINVDDNIIKDIQNTYKSDMRSMINYIQTNKRIFDISNKCIINTDKWNEIYNYIHKKNKNQITDYIYDISNSYNIDKREILINLIKLHIQNQSNDTICNVLEFSKKFIHNYDNKNSLFYFSEKFAEDLK
uniref:AAA+ ATPase domain-containing protein n=1 Tax=viral metagenome TaxID=1070528 RepID=A0A6C0AW67_9ZZZZ